MSTAFSRSPSASREPSCSPSCRRPCGHAVPQPVSPGSLSPLNPPKLVHRCRSYSSSGCSAGSVYVQLYGPGNLFPRRKGLEHRPSRGLALALLERRAETKATARRSSGLRLFSQRDTLHGRDLEKFGKAHRLEPSGLAQPAEALGTHLATLPLQHSRDEGNPGQEGSTTPIPHHDARIADCLANTPNG